MVVAENARHLIGQEIDLLVTSTLQTSAGRMIFGKPPSALDEEESDGDGRAGGRVGGLAPVVTRQGRGIKS